MNRAPDNAHERADDDLPEIPLSEHPNYVTPGGLAQLKARRDAVRAALGSLPADDDTPSIPDRALLERELRWLDHRLSGAISVDPGQQPADRVAFGATVTVDSDEGEQRWQIVGEDEADTEHGRVSYLSPLAQALLGARVGDEVTWVRPAGDLRIEVVAIEYRRE